MDERWESVHTVDDWYDGPREGVADYLGSHHYYRSVFLDTPKWNPDEDRFELTPISGSAYEAALELHVIWERWKAIGTRSVDHIQLMRELVDYQMMSSIGATC